MPAFKNYEVSMMEFRYLCPGASPFKLPQSSLSLAMGFIFSKLQGGCLETERNSCGPQQ